MADFYAARGGTIPPLPWSNFAPPLSGLFAGMCIVILPILAIYFWLGSRIIEGFTLGGGK